MCPPAITGNMGIDVILGRRILVCCWIGDINDLIAVHIKLAAELSGAIYLQLDGGICHADADIAPIRIQQKLVIVASPDKAAACMSAICHIT